MNDLTQNITDDQTRVRLEWAVEQRHARAFTLAELRHLADQGHEIFDEDGAVDLQYIHLRHDGFLDAVTTEDTFVQTELATVDRADEVDAYGRELEYGRPPTALRVIWQITAGDRTAKADPVAREVAATPAAAVQLLRRACELIRAGNPRQVNAPELVITAGPGAAAGIFTDPVHGPEARALADELARAEGQSGVRLETSNP